MTKPAIKPAIICVDDEPTVLESLKIELKQALGDSCLIETAESGEEALELFQELQSDRQYEVALVLADHIMPGMRGDELLSRIHAQSPQTLNLMVTGHADLETLSNVLRTAKLHRHIAKPWQSADLRATVLEALQNFQAARGVAAQQSNLQQTIAQLQQMITLLQQSEGHLWQQFRGQESLNRVYLALAMQQFQAVQEIQLQVQELKHLNQLKDQFLDSISHELRAPISNIRMATQMLEVRLRQLEIEGSLPQCERYFQILRSECQREVDLINDLLALIRLDSNTDLLTISAINLNLWIPHVVEPFIERTQEREQQLIVDLPSGLPILSTDLLHLERALTEILNNAWRYTPVGETITVAVRVVTLPPDAQLDAQLEAPLDAQPDSRPAYLLAPSAVAPTSEIWISISNTGIEIPAVEQPQIFNQFYRGSHSNFWHQSGSGLGLAIVKRRIEKLHGSIQVSSQTNCTTFTIQLPLHPYEFAP